MTVRSDRPISWKDCPTIFTGTLMDSEREMDAFRLMTMAVPEFVGFGFEEKG